MPLPHQKLLLQPMEAKITLLNCHGKGTKTINTSKKTRTILERINHEIRSINIQIFCEWILFKTTKHTKTHKKIFFLHMS